MSDIGLSANLEVNADGVQQGTQQAITSLQALQNRIVQVQEQLASAADDESFNRLATQYNNLSRNISALSNQQIQIPAVDLRPIEQTQQAISNVGTSANGLGNIVNRSMHGVADLFIAPGRAANIFANDLPVLVQRFQELRAEQQALAAAGQEAKTTTQLLGEAFNPLGLAIGLASIALIELVPKLVDYIEKANDSVDATKVLSDALSKDSGYKDAIANVEKLTEDIQLAKEGILSKTEVVKEYNDTIGKTTGQVSNLNQAEQALIKNKDAYLQMMADKAAATYAYQEAAKKAVEAQADELNIGSKPSITDFLKASFTSLPGLGATKLVQDRLDDISEANKKADDLNKIGDDFEKKADIAKKFNFNLFGDDGTKTSKTQSDKIADAITQIKRQQESLNDAFSKGNITNVQYYSQSIDLLTKSIQNLHDKYNLPFDGKILSGLQDQLDKLKISQPVDLFSLKGDANEADIKSIADGIVKTYKDAESEAKKQIKAIKDTPIDISDSAYKSLSDVTGITNKLSGQKQAIDFTYSINPKLELNAAEDKVQADMEAIRELIQKHIKGEISDKDFDITIMDLKVKYEKDSLDKTVEDANKELTASLNSLIDNGLDALGASMVTGDLSGIFDSLLSSLGGALEQFGEEMLALSITANILTDSLLKFFYTPAGIAAASGIIALGGAIKALAKKGLSPASGSSSYASVATPSMPTFYNPGSGSSSAATSAGSAVSGGGSLATNIGSSVGSTLNESPIAVEGNFTIKGNDLVTTINRTNNSKTR